MEQLKILLIGNGGREHALAWRLSLSPRVFHIYVAPGNGGTAQSPNKVSNVPIGVENFPALVEFAKTHDVNFVVPGPEVPLVAGVTDYFKNAIPNIRVFGPSKAAAKLEGSKTYAKDFMAKYNIPTARYENFSDYETAKSHIEQVPYPVVLKAAGLAAGKGVILPKSRDEAQLALKSIMVDKEFGSAGAEVVIEEYLQGDELSFLTFSDGWTTRSLPAAQDHKQVFDGAKGPNTGGMGAYAPAPIATPEMVEDIHRTVLQPTIDAMRKNERHPFVGLLFTGFMITRDGPKVLEYNVRFGDPETQTLLPLMSVQSDLAELMVACTEGWLDSLTISVKPESSVTIVAAAGGYPGSYNKGDAISIHEDRTQNKNDHIFHASTSLEGGSLKTAGGRVIAATSTAASLEDARVQASSIMASINFPNKHHRTDIAYRALKLTAQEQSTSKTANMTYAEAGVSISLGNKLVDRIKPLAKSTARPGASAEIGGFGGGFDLLMAGYKEPPLMVTGSDGVGTKLKVAQAIGKHNTIGIDLVAMNVNDIISEGAEPLWFTDVFSCGELDIDIATSVVEGVCNGCKLARCALVGGETAEMAGLFPPTEYDVTGTAIGAIARGRQQLPNKNAMKDGDVLLGLASSGCHSNGFSLIRKIIEKAGLKYSHRAPWDPKSTVGESLLTPTRIYVKSLLNVVNKNLVKGIAHITGGGLIENTPRMLPDILSARLNAARWECPEVMKWLKKAGNVNDSEFARVFNAGLGMILVVDQSLENETVQRLTESGEKVYSVGYLERRDDVGCIVRNMEEWNV